MSATIRLIRTARTFALGVNRLPRLSSSRAFRFHRAFSVKSDAKMSDDGGEKSAEEMAAELEDLEEKIRESKENEGETPKESQSDKIEDDPIDKVAAVIKEMLERGETVASQSLRSGEQIATTGIKTARDKFVEHSPLALEVKVPEAVQSTLDSTSHVAREGKRSAVSAASRVGETAEGVASSISKVGERFSDVLPDLPQYVKELPLTPELELALRNAADYAIRVQGKTTGIAGAIAKSVGTISMEGISTTARVANSFADSTVDMIRHSFGKEAGNIAAGGLNLARELAGVQDGKENKEAEAEAEAEVGAKKTAESPESASAEEGNNTEPPETSRTHETDAKEERPSK